MLNQAELIGHLAKKPELRYTAQNTAIAQISLATSHSYTQNNEKKTETEWHIVSVWGKLAENCEKYLDKGSKIYVRGRIKTETYKKDGVDQYVKKIIADKILFLSESKGTNNNNYNDNQYDDYPPF